MDRDDPEADPREPLLGDAGSGAGRRAAAPAAAGALNELLSRLDVLDALEDLEAGGQAGLATGVEILAESGGGPGSLLDAFEPVRDLADHTDLFDDLF